MSISLAWIFFIMGIIDQCINFSGCFIGPMSVFNLVGLCLIGCDILIACGYFVYHYRDYVK